MRRLFVLSCLVIFLMLGGLQQPAASTPAPRVEITARRFTYDPDTITLKKGVPVMLVLKSEDVSHGLQIRELGLDLKTSKNKPAEMLFTPRKTGTFVGHCSVFCGAKHGTMKITFHVTD